MIKQYKIIDAVFLLMVTIAGSIVFGSLDHDKRHFFVNNLLFKNFIVFSLIYFLSNSLISSTHNPINELRNSFLIWILFVIFIKLDKSFVVTGIIMLVIYYIIGTVINFKEQDQEKEKNQRLHDVLVKSQQFIVYAMASVCGIGYIVYLNSLYDRGGFTWSDIF